MAKNLYSAYMSAGKSAGQYKASLLETFDWADKFDFIGKQTAWEEEKTSRKVSLIGDTLELASTISGGYQDKQKFDTRSDALVDKYGDLQADTRNWKEKTLDYLTGKEQTYTYGEGDSAETFSRAGVFYQGGMELGESMFFETGIGVDKNEENAPEVIQGEESLSSSDESTSAVVETDLSETAASFLNDIKSTKDSVNDEHFVSNNPSNAISENIKRPETLDESAGNGKSLYDIWQTASGGLTKEANLRLYNADPSMKGKSKEIRTSRYRELFGDNKNSEIDFDNITNPLGF